MYRLILATKISEDLEEFKKVFEDQQGWHLRVAPSVDDLVAMIDRKTDLVLLDSGFGEESADRLIPHIKNSHPDFSFRVLVIADRVKGYHFYKYIQSGADEFIRRPIDRFISLARITSLCRHKQSEESINEKERILRLNAKKLAHDLSNPISVIDGQVQLIGMSKKFDEKRMESILSATRVTYAILEQAKKQLKVEDTGAVDCAWVSVRTCLDEVLELFNHKLEGKQIETSIEGEELFDQWELWCDELLFKYSILSNIISNSIKFTDRGGKLTVKVKIEESGHVSVSISDNGTGMTPEQLEQANSGRSLESSSGTGGEAGTGFGVTIMQKYIELLGGRYEVHSPPIGESKGTQTIIFLSGRSKTKKSA